MVSSSNMTNVSWIFFFSKFLSVSVNFLLFVQTVQISDGSFS